MLELHGGDTYHLKEQLDDGSLDGAVIRTQSTCKDAGITRSRKNH